MNSVIGKISEIESSATSIMDDANARKKAFAKEIEDRTNAFDAQLESETAQLLNELRTKMEIDMHAKLSKQKSDAANVLKQMEDTYLAEHTAYAEELFQAMTKE